MTTGQSDVEVVDRLVVVPQGEQGIGVRVPVVAALGDEVKKGTVLIDGPSTKQGELAIGRNLLVAYGCIETNKKSD